MHHRHFPQGTRVVFYLSPGFLMECTCTNCSYISFSVSPITPLLSSQSPAHILSSLLTATHHGNHNSSATTLPTRITKPRIITKVRRDRPPPTLPLETCQACRRGPACCNSQNLATDEQQRIKSPKLGSLHLPNNACKISMRDVHKP